MKPLIKSTALALAAVAAPVLAQSSLTMYGRVDLGLFHQNAGTTPINAGIAPPGPGAEMWQVRQGSAGRLGFRGVEDLGGGLQANFLMEHRFASDSGRRRNALLAGPLLRRDRRAQGLGHGLLRP